MSSDYKEIMEEADQLCKSFKELNGRNANLNRVIEFMCHDSSHSFPPQVLDEYQTATMKCAWEVERVANRLAANLSSMFDEDDGGDIPKQNRIACEMYALLHRIADKNAELNGRDVQLASGIADDIWELLGEAKEYFGEQDKGGEE